jgi:hypothetical protein
VFAAIVWSLDLKMDSGIGSKRRTKKRVLNDGWILQSELQRKKTRISLVGFSKRGRRASWAGSVKVSTSSKIIILGLSENPKSPVPADSVKG